MKITSCVIFFFIACGVVGNTYALPIPQPTPPPPGYEVPEFGPPDIIYEPEGEPTPPPELWQKAEEPNITQAPDITTEQVAAFLATKFGIPPKSKITHRFHDLILNYKTGTEIARKKSKIITKSGVYRHFRFGKGILFPSEDELKPIAPTQEEKKAILESIVEGQKKLKAKLQKPAYKQSPGQERRSADLMKFSTPKHLPVCSEDKTISQKNRENHPSYIGNDGDTNGVLFDVLFLQQSAPQMKNLLTGSEELFGLSTRVEYYSEMPGITSSFVVSNNDVECLPFRLTVTNKSVERRYGEDALKRYNEETRKWELHPTIQKKLKEFF